MRYGISRRAFLGALSASAAAQVKQPFKKAKPLPVAGEFARVIDPATENVVVRLTVPSSSSMLSYVRNRCISLRERVLVFSSNRTGHFAPFLLDLHTGAVKQIADAAKLNPRSLCLDRSEKSVRYLDGSTLFEAGVAHGTPRQLAENITSFTNASDGSIFLTSAGKLMRRNGGESRALAEEVTDSWPQPNSAGCLFARTTGPDERELFYVPADASAKPLLIASGRVREPFWDADGQSILFLRDVTSANGTILAEIHGRRVLSGDQNGAEYVVAQTSQFATFAPNSDSTVFVGASRSRAQPTVDILLRSPHREMTLCEHRATHPGDVSPFFSPDNRRVYFESDHEGQPAIYSVNVELLVEPGAA